MTSTRRPERHPRRSRESDAPLSKPVSLTPAMGLVHVHLAAGRKPRRPSGPRTLLLSLGVIGALATVVGAGTFASYTSSVTNSGSTFATGTVVLSNTPTATSTTCLSTGNTNVIGDISPTDSSELTSNAGTCAAAISVGGSEATGAKPGVPYTLEFDLKNEGTISGALSLYGTSCTNAAASDQSFFNGGSSALNACSYVNFTAGHATGSRLCLYGRGASAVVNGASLTFPVVVNNGTDKFRLTIDGVTTGELDITSATYQDTTAGRTSFITEVNDAIGANDAVAALSGTDQLYITSKSRGASSSIAILDSADNPSDTTLANLQMTSPTYVQGSENAACSFDPTHTIGDFLSTFDSSANALALGTLNTLVTNRYTLKAQVEYGSRNELQGRQATFDLIWTLQ